ncbi:DNA-binding protein [Coniella lustricola]|uniref:DNA-binding protein n=1 Tax=Coniella lustricola TaxID=2025994 RepID=A0A2T3A246_9PEZI|nr:DNA-binding protein [Coniella lustricola]
MSVPPPSAQQEAEALLAPPTMDVPITDARTLFSCFTSFLTVAIHTILYYRNVYPKETFLSSKAFNLPVHQSRHPKVCSWITDAVDAVMAQVAKGTVDRMAVVVHSPSSSSPFSTPATRQLPSGTVMERWMFDTSYFPVWPGGIEALKNFRGEAAEEDEPAVGGEHRGGGDGNIAAGVADRGAAENDRVAANINWADVHEQLRGAVRRLAQSGEKMDALPTGCTFTVVVELREQAQAPIGHPQPWIPSQPELQPAAQSKRGRELSAHDATTTPIRSLEVGPLFVECWVEESRAKDALRAFAEQESQSTT